MLREPAGRAVLDRVFIFHFARQNEISWLQLDDDLLRRPLAWHGLLADLLCRPHDIPPLHRSCFRRTRPPCPPPPPLVPALSALLCGSAAGPSRHHHICARARPSRGTGAPYGLGCCRRPAFYASNVRPALRRTNPHGRVPCAHKLLPLVQIRRCGAAHFSSPRACHSAYPTRLCARC